MRQVNMLEKISKLKLDGDLEFGMQALISAAYYFKNLGLMTTDPKKVFSLVSKDFKEIQDKRSSK